MTTRRTHRGRRRSGSERRARAIVAGVALLVAGACVHARAIGDPVPGAVERAERDSASVVLEAANRALIDEGFGVQMIDRERSFVESPWVEVTHLHVSTNLDQYEGERVRFRFRALRMLGGTRLLAEAVYQPLPEAGRTTEQMVPGGHPARQVLARMLDDIEGKLRDRR